MVLTKGRRLQKIAETNVTNVTNDDVVTPEERGEDADDWDDDDNDIARRREEEKDRADKIHEEKEEEDDTGDGPTTDETTNSTVIPAPIPVPNPSEQVTPQSNDSNSTEEFVPARGFPTDETEKIASCYTTLRGLSNNFLTQSEIVL